MLSLLNEALKMARISFVHSVLPDISETYLI